MGPLGGLTYTKEKTRELSLSLREDGKMVHKTRRTQREPTAAGATRNWTFSSRTLGNQAVCVQPLGWYHGVCTHRLLQLTSLFLGLGNIPGSGVVAPGLFHSSRAQQTGTLRCFITGFL